MAGRMDVDCSRLLTLLYPFIHYYKYQLRLKTVVIPATLPHLIYGVSQF